MQEWLAPFDLLAETCLHVDASGLDVGRAGQLGAARQLAIIDMDDAPGARGDDGMGLCGDRRGAHAALGFTDRRNFRPRPEAHTSELQSLMRTSYADFCLHTTT